MHVRSMVTLNPNFEHDCDRCVLVGAHFGAHGIEDVYLCVPKQGGAMGSIIFRRSSEGSDYSSFPLSFEGEPDPTRRRLPFSQIRIIEGALSTMQAICRAYEDAVSDGKEQRAANILAFLDDVAWFGGDRLKHGRLTEEKIRSVSYLFHTNIATQYPVIYTPFESTPAPEGAE